ncbi:MAG: glycosyltransferase [Dehalococcoidia bacterium]
MSDARRVVLTGGGTGGHFYPALAVAEALRCRMPDIDLHYVGTSTGAESRLAPAAGFSYESVPSGQVRGKSPFKVASSLARIAAGTLSSRGKMGAASAVFATGGYASVPVITGAWLRRVPVVLFLPDVEPGWAVRSTASMAARIGVSNEAAVAALPADKTEVTGYPTRARFGELSREEARTVMGVPLDGRVLLVSGASTGAQRINAAVTEVLPELLDLAVVIHSTGPANLDDALAKRDGLPEGQKVRYHVYGLIEDMPAAMQAADLTIMRSGASVLGELPAAGLPSILIPGTFAGGHQKANAEALARAGAAVVLEEKDFGRLLETTRDLLNDQERLDAMGAAAKASAHRDAADRLAQLVLEVAR